MFEGWSSLSVLLSHKEQTEERYVTFRINLASKINLNHLSAMLFLLLSSLFACTGQICTKINT